MRAAFVLLFLVAACGGSGEAESPLAHAVEHLREHGFVANEVQPHGTPLPIAAAEVELDGATATIYAYATEDDAHRATSAFAAEEQEAPERVRVQREGAFVYVGRADSGRRLPVVQFEDVVFTSEEDD